VPPPVILFHGALLNWTDWRGGDWVSAAGPPENHITPANPGNVQVNWSLRQATAHAANVPEGTRPYLVDYSTPPGSTVADMVWVVSGAVARVKALTGQPSVVLFGHSLGGIMARAYVQGFVPPAEGGVIRPTTPGYGNDVVGLFTVATPHSGISALFEPFKDINDFLCPPVVQLFPSEPVMIELQNGTIPVGVEVANIVATGCYWGWWQVLGFWDGVLFANNQHLLLTVAPPRLEQNDDGAHHSLLTTFPCQLSGSVPAIEAARAVAGDWFGSKFP
jgi:hypothetical protein